MQPSRVIREYLIDGGYVTGSKTDMTVTTNCFCNYDPQNVNGVDLTVSIFDFGKDKSSYAGIEDNIVTIKVKSTNQFDCTDKAEEIQTFIRALPDKRIQGVTGILFCELIEEKWVSVFNINFKKTIFSIC